MQIVHWFLTQYYSHYYSEMRWMLIFFSRAWQEMFLLPAEIFGQFSLLECLQVYLSHRCFLSLLKEKKFKCLLNWNSLLPVMLMLVILWNCLGAGTGFWDTDGDRELLLKCYSFIPVLKYFKLICGIPEWCWWNLTCLHKWKGFSSFPNTCFCVWIWIHF